MTNGMARVIQSPVRLTALARLFAGVAASFLFILHRVFLRGRPFGRPPVYPSPVLELVMTIRTGDRRVPLHLIVVMTGHRTVRRGATTRNRTCAEVVVCGAVIRPRHLVACRSRPRSREACRTELGLGLDLDRREGEVR